MSTVPDHASPVSKTEQIWGIWWHKGGHEVKQTRPCLSEAEIRTDLIQAICTTACHLHLYSEPFQFERNEPFKGPVHPFDFIMPNLYHVHKKTFFFRSVVCSFI